MACAAQQEHECCKADAEVDKVERKAFEHEVGAEHAVVRASDYESVASVVVDHDPKSLRMQLEAHHGSRCGRSYLEQGPDVWRVGLRLLQLDGMGAPLIHHIYNPGHHADAALFATAKFGVRQHHLALRRYAVTGSGHGRANRRNCAVRARAPGRQRIKGRTACSTRLAVRDYDGKRRSNDGIDVPSELASDWGATPGLHIGVDTQPGRFISSQCGRFAASSRARGQG